MWLNVASPGEKLLSQRLIEWILDSRVRLTRRDVNLAEIPRSVDRHGARNPPPALERSLLHQQRLSRYGLVPRRSVGSAIRRQSAKTWLRIRWQQSVHATDT